MVFPVVMWEVNHKEGWMLKNWCFWIAVLEKTLVSPLDSKEIKPVISKGNQPWIFIGRTGAKTESPWPPDGMSWLIRKDLMLGKLQGKRRGQQRIIWLNSISDSMDMNLSKLWEIVKDREAWHAEVHGVTKSQTRLSNWTTTWGFEMSAFWEESRKYKEYCAPVSFIYGVSLKSCSISKKNKQNGPRLL